MKTEQALLYLADQRGCSQTEEYRSFHTFNSENYYDEYRKPFGNLIGINDDTLKPGCSKQWVAGQDTMVTIFPLVGKLLCHDSFGNDYVADAGQMLNFFVPKHRTFTISNPYLSELINYLHIWTAGYPSPNETHIIKSELDLSYSNTLMPIMTGGSVSILIGKFDGRFDEKYHIQNHEKGIFAYIVDGAFEVQGRLLDARDALSLKKSETIEFEALSSQGIILLIEES